MAADTSKMPDPTKIYMTEVVPQGRYARPRFRTHYSLGAAKNAISQQYDSVRQYLPFSIYHLLDNEWHVVYSVTTAVKYEDLPWK